MKRYSQLALAAALGVVFVAGLACGGSSTDAQDSVEEQVGAEVEEAKEDAASEDAPAAGAPKVSESYQRTINRGWEKAVAGETPAYACAGLKGRLMGTESADDPEALEALFACNVLLPVRYFETLLEEVEAGESSCYEFQRDMSIQLSAMTVSMDSIQGMADAFAENPDEPDADTIASTLGEVALAEGLTDPERQVKERLEEPVRRICPDAADSILR